MMDNLTTGTGAGVDMKADWNSRAEADAMYYIAPFAGGEEPLFMYTGLVTAAEILTDAFPLLRNYETVLEVGCGMGRILQHVSRCFPYAYGVDVSPEMITKGREFMEHLDNVVLSEMDGASIEFPDNFIDLMYCTFVLEHIPVRGTALNLVRDMGRILKPGGILVLNTGITNYVKDPDQICNTWNGVKWTTGMVDDMLHSNGLRIVGRRINPTTHRDRDGLCTWWHYWTTSRKEESNACI